MKRKQLFSMYNCLIGLHWKASLQNSVSLFFFLLKIELFCFLQNMILLRLLY